VNPKNVPELQSAVGAAVATVPLADPQAPVTVVV